MSGPAHPGLILLWGLGLTLLVSFAVFALVSIRERERRAATIAFALTVICAVVILAASFWPIPILRGLLGVLAALLLLAVVAWFLPIGSAIETGGRPRRRVDERDIMFARARLEPGSQEFDTYYTRRPEHRESDDRTRSLPGLLSPRAPLADPVSFGSAKASFAITEALRD